MENSIKRRVSYIVDWDNLIACIQVCTNMYNRQGISYSYSIWISEIIKVEFELWR
jgi:hypothetical protein